LSAIAGVPEKYHDDVFLVYINLTGQNMNDVINKNKRLANPAACEISAQKVIPGT
jgi:hypothetical protein